MHPFIRSIACIFLRRKIGTSLFEQNISQKYSRATAISTFKDKKRVIVMWDDSPFSPGLADKLKGCLSLWLLCQKFGIKDYKIYWTTPFVLEDYLQPNDYDWRISPNNLIHQIGITHPIMIHKLANILFQERLDAWIFKKRVVNGLPGEYHLYSNMVYHSNEYAEAFKHLFKMSPKLENEVSNHKKKLGHYVSFSFRFLNLLGDFKDEDGFNEPLSKEEASTLVERCYNQMETIIRSLPNNISVFVASDSITFLNYAKQNHKVYIVEGEIAHSKFKSTEEATLKTFVDLMLLSGAEKLYLLQSGKMYGSGFPWLASKIGNKPFENIIF